MVGSNVIEEISKNEKVQERTEKTLDLFDQYLEKKIKEDKEQAMKEKDGWNWWSVLEGIIWLGIVAAALYYVF